MVMIHTYHIVERENGADECISCENSSCPECGGILLCRDRRIRKYRDTDGKKRNIWIRRMKCVECGRLHNELPDFLVPYKQHVSITIERALKEEQEEKEILKENIPDKKTLRRWKKWIQNICLWLRERDGMRDINDRVRIKSDEQQSKSSSERSKEGWLTALIELALLNKVFTSSQRQQICNFNIFSSDINL